MIFYFQSLIIPFLHFSKTIFTTKKTQLAFLALLCTALPRLPAQNLIQNGSFEDYTECPYGLSQIEFAVGWKNFHATPEFMHECATQPFVSTPYNIGGGYQPVYEGKGYAAFFAYESVWVPVFGVVREFIAYELSAPLQVGQTYYVSYKVSLAYNGWFSFCACNNLGVKFTTQSYGNFALVIEPFHPLMDNKAHINTTEIISDTVNWVTISGSFVADSAYNYLVLGNFFDKEHTDTLVLVNAPNCPAYYYADDVCLSLNPFTCDMANGLGNTDAPSPILSRSQHGKNLFVVFDSNVLLGRTQISLYDMSGRTLKSEPLRDYTLNLDCSDLPPGMYVFKINMGRRSFVEKFIIY